MKEDLLSRFRWDLYSQSGEDGIIDELISRIQKVYALNGWCVEFGAWDGRHLSNTARLIERKGYRSILIEPNHSRFKQLCRNYPNQNVIKLNTFVDFSSNRIDNILLRHSAPEDIDVMSIDIDGADYWILDSLDMFRPKILIIEYNPTIPFGVEFVQNRDMSIRQGSSAKSILLLARKKNYVLASVTHCNLIFVQERFQNAVFGDAGCLELNSDLEDKALIRYAFTGYDGTIFIWPNLNLHWQGIQLSAKALQALPKILRKFPPVRFRNVFAVDQNSFICRLRAYCHTFYLILFKRVKK